MLNQQIATQQNVSVNAELLEKVIVNNDLGGLSPIEKVTHIKTVCESLGLNPLTKPIQLLKFQGKEIAYFTKDATEQLRKKHNVSLSIKETKIIDDLYIVVAEAKLPDGRTDAATGAVTISGLKGDAKANAIMKAETKAKRRATLSICGLGFLDESERDTMHGAKKIDIYDENNNQEMLEKFVNRIHDVESMDELHGIYTEAYKYFATHRDQESLKVIIDAKDRKKESLAINELEADIPQ